jgi:hypothetical protein
MLHFGPDGAPLFAHATLSERSPSAKTEENGDGAGLDRRWGVAKWHDAAVPPDGRPLPDGSNPVFWSRRGLSDGTLCLDASTSRAGPRGALRTTRLVDLLGTDAEAALLRDLREVRRAPWLRRMVAADEAGGAEGP